MAKTAWKDALRVRATIQSKICKELASVADDMSLTMISFAQKYCRFAYKHMSLSLSQICFSIITSNHEASLEHCQIAVDDFWVTTITSCPFFTE